jgi:hypothetical protein
MTKYLRQTAILFTASVALILSSCAESKVAQCNKLIDVANQAAKASLEFGENPHPEKGGKAFTEMADKIDTLTASMSALEMSDEKLKGYQTNFVSMYTAASKGLRGGAVAFDKKDVAAMNKEMAAIQTATGGEAKLVGDINTYCSAK